MLDKIVAFEDRQGKDFFGFVIGVMRRQLGLVPPKPEAESIAGTVMAEIDDSRWIVKCPNDVCAGALLVSPEVPLFICVDCGSPENGQRWYNVEFPANRAEIEGTLLRRPHTTRHPDGHLVGRAWLPGEALARLRKQNKELGVG